jgi:HAD superfamily hydrolase (TIGR01509 family)
MFWPEISITDLKQLDTVFQEKNHKNCLNINNYAGFVFFDIGSVLLDLDWDLFIYEFEKLLPPEATKNHKQTNFLLKREEILKRWCTGKIGAFDYANSFIAALKESAGIPYQDFHLSIHDIKRADSFVVGAARQSVIELAKKLREKKFGIGVLSNATTWHEIMIEKRIPVRDLFDITIFSQDLGCEKPDHKIYELAFLEAQRFISNKFSATLEAKDIYFIDDTPANVRAAREVGWNASLVNLLNDETLKKVLSENMDDDELKAASRKREHLVFGYNASQRVEKIFGNILKI